MNVEKARKYLLSLPHVVETMQWGDNLVFWVGDKAIGGKMFALVSLDGPENHGVMSFSAGPERFAELVEVEGMYPAPYFARIHWLAAERWTALRDREWQDQMQNAHAITLGKLPKKVREALDLPDRARNKLIAERRKLLAAKAKAKAK
jgi:predicted DNA-binding protein (MmcQ/YjbR family)